MKVELILLAIIPFAIIICIIKLITDSSVATKKLLKDGEDCRRVMNKLKENE